ncbi:ATP-binding protein [Lacinutrix undariae]
MVKSYKIFIVLLILSISMLIYLGSNSYKQITNLEKTAEMVMHRMRVETEINNLFSQYAMMSNKVFENILLNKPAEPHLLNTQKENTKKTFEQLSVLIKNNTEQQNNLNELSKLQDTFYNTLYQLNTNTKKEKNALNTLSLLTRKIEVIKVEMLNYENTLLTKRQAQFSQSRQLNPILILFLGMSAVLTFIISFWQINKQRKANNKTTAFLESVLKNTENVVSYYTPIKDRNNTIIDFKVVYVNENIESILETPTTDLKNKLLSEVIPILFENGVFEAFVNCYETGNLQSFEKDNSFNEQHFRFKTNVVKLNDGVLATAIDITEEYAINKNLVSTKNQLETQNLALLDNRAFLSNIFKSTSNIVMHFKSIRNNHGKIIDFETLFTNDTITDATGDILAEIKHKKASELYPAFFQNGVFEKMVTCIEESRQIEYETQYHKNGKNMWFNATAIKLNDGVTITSRDITLEKSRAEKLNVLNGELEIQNSIFKDAENVADIGSYIWYLDTGSAIISDNFYRILGYTPNEFEVTFNSYREFVHPDDLEHYNQLGMDTVAHGKSSIHTYRVITKNGDIKHLYVNGRTVEKNGKAASVGVIQDITNRVKTEEKLRTRNLELKRSNAELESFNRVASHDLQEPMRKIQMFVSRLSEGELDRLSEKGRMYFDKIDSSANRMQTLIKYLLAYSRINRTKKDFVKTALNDVLIKVLDDLEERIEESGVVITADTLPILKVIPFQMEQLFTNLISNAIKYRSTTAPSKINITCEKISRNKITEVFDKKRKNYYKIAVIDNGIGFDQENAKKIFGLFARLHQKEEYSGTGIGLAICKKIAVNHKGHIVAQSEPQKGATFCVYLPA